MLCTIFRIKVSFVTAKSSAWDLHSFVIFVVLLSAAISAPAQAKTPQEQQWEAYDGWQVASFRLEGAPDHLKGKLKSGLALEGNWRFLRGRARPSFRARLLREDIARIRLFLAREGYPAAEVEPQLAPHPQQRRLDLVLRVVAGSAAMVASVQVKGWPAGTTRADSLAGITLKPGARFQDLKLEQSRLQLIRQLMDRGYARAVATAEVLPDSGSRVAVVYTVRPGSRYDITEVTINGCSPDLIPLTRRLIGITPPAPYSASRLEDSAFELRATRLYRQVTLREDSLGPGRLRLAVEVENARMHSIDASVGTWSNNPWMVHSSWNNRNLLGGGRGLEAHAAAASHSLKAGGGLTWFGWLSPRARARAGVEWVREDEDTYLSKEWSLSLTRSLRPKGRDMAHTGLSLSRVTLTPFSKVDGSGVDQVSNLVELWADRTWDWTDSPLQPRTGGFAKLMATLSPPVGLVESPYVLAQGDLSLYRPCGRWGVLAGHVRMGIARPLNGAGVVIPNRRFYAGGYSTMRGYGRRQLGPRDDAGVPLGGDAVMLVGAETRVPVVWVVDLVLFVDSGQIWWKPGDIRLADIATATGVGLDFHTPLGPLRVSYARNLGKVIPGEPRAMWHFGVGYPW